MTARPARILGTPMPLHNVRDVESHCRVILDRELTGSGASLKPEVYERFLTALVELCWHPFSGLEADGQTPMRGVLVIVWKSIDAIEDDDADDQGDELRARRQWFRTAAEADAYAGEQIDEHPEWIVEFVDDAPPIGAYNPAHGIAFSTYSRRILSKRVVDLFRAELGDSRYSGRPREISFEAAAARQDADGEAPEQFLPLHAPAHDDPYEEVLHRVSLAQ